MRGYWLAACAVVLGGCATIGPMQGIMSSWEGASVDEVIQQWGYPHSERELAGRRLLYWERNMQMALPGATTGTATRVGNTVFYNQTTAAPSISNWSCLRILEVQANTVVGWQVQGNNCPLVEVGPYADWRRKP